MTVPRKSPESLDKMEAENGIESQHASRQVRLASHIKPQTIHDPQGYPH